MSVTLAIDFGTSFTAAAIAEDGEPPHQLEIEHDRRLESLVVLTEDGQLVAGRLAVNEALRLPDRVERTPKRYLGYVDQLVLGGTPVPVVDVVATVLSKVGAEARRRYNGRTPDRLVLTHPVRWHPRRVEALGASAKLAGLPDPTFVTEPVAAACSYTSAAIPDGHHIAVYDLGGGTFDTAVLQRRNGEYVVAGPPGGDPDLGGEVFDERLFSSLGAAIAAHDEEIWTKLRVPTERRWRIERAKLLRQAREAKEALSEQQSLGVYIGPLDTDLRVTRQEFVELIRDDIDRSVRELASTISAASVDSSQLDVILLTGGSSRVPLVASAIHHFFGIAPTTVGDPKLAIVLGALRMPLMGPPERGKNDRPKKTADKGSKATSKKAATGQERNSRGPTERGNDDRERTEDATAKRAEDARVKAERAARRAEKARIASEREAARQAEDARITAESDATKRKERRKEAIDTTADVGDTIMELVPYIFGAILFISIVVWAVKSIF